MKKNIALIIAVFISSAIMAQDSFFITIFHKYEKAENCTSVEMSSKMISMLVRNTNDENLAEQLKGIKSIIMLTIPVSYKDVERDLNAYIKYKKLRKLSSSYADGISDDYYLLEDDNGSTFIMLSNNKQKYTIVYIYGRFDIKNISKLSKIAK